jgi:hypothetical protein
MADLGLYAFVMIIGALAYQLLVTPLGSLVCARLAATRLLGEPCTFAEAFAHARKRYWPTQVALALFLLPLLGLAVLVLVFVLVFQQAGNQTAVGVAAVAGVALISLAAFVMQLLFCRLFMALNGVVQAVEAPEGSGMLQQGLWYLRRGYELTAGHFWRMLGFLLLASVVVYVITNGMMQGIRLLVTLVRLTSIGDNAKQIYNALATPTTWELGMSMMLGGLISLIFPPFWQCLKTLLYFDMRCRKEGFDLLRMLSLPGGQADE